MEIMSQYFEQLSGLIGGSILLTCFIGILMFGFYQFISCSAKAANAILDFKNKIKQKKDVE